MSPAKQQLLFERYPALFRNRLLPKDQSCMCWGIETQGDGWFDILDKMCSYIELLKSVVPDLDVTFDQVKSKFGGLRVYRGVVQGKQADEWGDIVDAIISQAEADSLGTCEETGKYGHAHYSGSGWVRTLNPEKAKELDYLTQEEYRDKMSARGCKIYDR